VDDASGGKNCTPSNLETYCTTMYPLDVPGPILEIELYMGDRESHIPLEDWRFRYLDKD